jgi:putative mRNA 3-end processing factor
MTKKGLFCQAGQFYIDPSGAVDHAIVTHAHADHARRGSKQYYCVQSGTELLKARLSQKIAVKSYAYQEIFELGGVKISFHPAGHILGSCQVRLEYAGEVWVVSGDYKREADPTCEPFEVVTCDVFVTEATFGTPGYTWKKEGNVGEEIYNWWQANAEKKINSVLYAYSLGKTQRLLGVLKPFAKKTIYCHPAAGPLNEIYRQNGFDLADTKCISQIDPTRKMRGELFIVPQGFLKTDKSEIIGDQYRTAFASGWMARGAYGYDKGFLMSDHADWNDLLLTIKQSQAKTVYVQHRGQGALVKHLRDLGLKAYPDSDLTPQNPNQLAFF